LRKFLSAILLKIAALKKLTASSFKNPGDGKRGFLLINSRDVELRGAVVA
jgi:hypothetical protein